MKADLTVLMPVYNGENYLADCVQSILDQTYSNFRFLIIDDGSQDNTREIIRSFCDSRIDLVELKKNVGHIRALNRGLEMITTKMVARMDADDISLPERFEKQLNFLESHPQVGICGTFITAFEGKRRTRVSFPCHHHDIKVKLLFEFALAHPALMMRKDLLDAHELKYNELIDHSYDWDLYQRAARFFELANLPEYLLDYRLHDQSVTVLTSDRQDRTAATLDDRTLAQLKLDNHPLRDVHRDVSVATLRVRNRDKNFSDRVLGWFACLKKANDECNIYDKEALNRFLKKRLFIVLTKNTRFWKKGMERFIGEKLYLYIPRMWTFKFLIKIGSSFVLSAFRPNSKNVC